MSTLPLADQADPSQVERIRPLVSGRACVVVGSAPLSTPTAPVDPSECVIAVNGGISSAPGPVGLWVMNSKQQDRPNDPLLTALHKAMLSQGTGRTAGHILFLRGPKVASEGYTLTALKQMGARYQTWSVLDKPTKVWIEQKVCDRKRQNRPCSAGILSVAMALWCGASHVRMVGFSLKAGYHYLPNETPKSWWRDHLEADQRALKALGAQFGDRLSGSILQQVAA